MPKLHDLLNDDKKSALVRAKKKTAPAVAQAAARHGTVTPDFVALDVETTGLDFKLDRVIEIGAVKFVGGVAKEEFSTFINAGLSIPDHITRLTNIDNDDIAGAPQFADITGALLEFIGTLPLCGHQIEFDLTFVNEELKRAGREIIEPQLIDTALLARMLLQHAGRFSLKHACAALDVTLNNAHRALHDAKASGEVAQKLIPMIDELPLSVRRALAAFAPKSLLKTIIIKSIGKERYGVDLDAGAPLNLDIKIDAPQYVTPVDVDLVEKMFSDGGTVSSTIDGFTVRDAQRKMARGVMSALNGGGILVAEAPTGTGKSLAYLVPSALFAMQNNCRIVISTHTRNLQDQLIDNDLPAVSAITKKIAKADGVKLRYTKLKGRGNYLCRHRFYSLLRGEKGNLSPRERNAVLPLIVWSQKTKSGDVEEQTFFSPKWFFKVWSLISADGINCQGRRCPYYQGCFLQQARQKAQTSHIVVINHALFYSDVCSESSLLGSIGSIVFDEAHHLESSGHAHLRTEFDGHLITAYIEKLQNFLHTLGAQGANCGAAPFESEFKSLLKRIRKQSNDTINELLDWAKNKEPANSGDYQIALSESSFVKLLEPASLDITFNDLKDAFHRLKQTLQAADKNKCENLREETQICAEETSQLRADLQYLIAAKTEGHVFWIEGNHKKRTAKLCGVPLDISELLGDIWERCNGGVVFTSATLATSNVNRTFASAKPTLDYFKHAVGLGNFADRETSLVLKSPYSAEQTLFGAFRNCPSPEESAFIPFVSDVIAQTHLQTGKNILALFTSNAMLNSVYTQLSSHKFIDRNKLLAQNISGNRSSMLEEFKTQRGMILLGTDSFWEGVDAPGESCEVVIITKLPFLVPTHPLTQALGNRMEALYGSSFFSYSVPEAIIKFRQGIGRLIRSVNDTGTLLVLDNRILTKSYGKQFILSTGLEINEFTDIENMLENLRRFFAT